MLNTVCVLLVFCPLYLIQTTVKVFDIIELNTLWIEIDWVIALCLGWSTCIHDCTQHCVLSVVTWSCPAAAFACIHWAAVCVGYYSPYTGLHISFYTSSLESLQAVNVLDVALRRTFFSDAVLLTIRCFNIIDRMPEMSIYLLLISDLFFSEKIPDL